MKYLAALLLILGFGLSGFGQTIKSLGYNTTNGQVVANTAELTFTNETVFNGLRLNTVNGYIFIPDNDGLKDIFFFDSGPEGLDAQRARANLGFSTNLNTLWTATNASNARSAVGLGETNSATFQSLSIAGASQSSAINLGNSVAMFTSTNNQDGVTFTFTGDERAYLGNDGLILYYNGGNLAFGTNNTSGAAISRTNLGLGWPALTNTNSATSLLGFTTNGQVVANTGTNVLTFSNTVQITTLTNVGGGIFTGDMNYANNGISGYGGREINFEEANIFGDWTIYGSLNWNNTTNAATTRTNLGLGATNTVTFGGIVNNGNFTNNNGTIYGLKTNVGPFEGIGNFFASNNTTLSNETLFRVGLAEATNKSAQFGFRVTRTNNGGEGVAVYSVFGYNALMMIGPSDRSRINYATNTNAGVEATLWTITPTNQVMTLRDTNTGATTFHQSLGFDTNVTSTAPANTTNIVKWIEVWVGTNSYRMPLYQ